MIPVTIPRMLWAMSVVSLGGVAFGGEAMILYLYYAENSGLLLTGSLAADIVIGLAGLVAMIVYGKDMYHLRRAMLMITRTTKKEENND